MNRVDRWWNEQFPPLSVRRLAFGWAIMPVVALIIAAVQALGPEPFNVPVFWMTLVGSEVMIFVGWYIARTRMDDLPPVEETLPDPWTTIGKPTWEVPGPESAPLQPQSPTPGTGHPIPLPDPQQQRSEFAREAISMLHRPRAPEGSRLSDALITFAIMAVTMTVIMWTASDYTAGFGRTDLLMALGMAALVTAALVFRDSIIMLLVVSAILGYLGAAVLRVFFLFLSDDDGIFKYWVIATLGALTMVMPLWVPARTKRRKRGAIRFPAWSIALPTSALMIMAALFASPSTGMPGRAPDTSGTPASAVEDNSPSALGAVTAGHAVDRLLQARREGSRADALRVASAQAADVVFEMAPGGVIDHCSEVRFSSATCEILTASGRAELQIGEMADGRYFIRSATASVLPVSSPPP